ncbi:transposase [Acetobacter orleanensis NRIC 0473]|nr:transposase [Acetobacter orleanensis NRIC 0473]
MFKILVIQTLNNLSDERTEYLINDRLSFMRFLGLGRSRKVPAIRSIVGIQAEAVGPRAGGQNSLAVSRTPDPGGCH